MLLQVKKLEVIVTCGPTLIVYYYIISSYTHKQFSCAKPLHLGYISALNMICRTCMNHLFFFWHHSALFHLAWLLICWISQCVMPTWLLIFHFEPLGLRYKLFPWWILFLIEPNSTLQFRRSSSGKRAADQPLCGLFKSSWHVFTNTVHDSIRKIDRIIVVRSSSNLKHSICTGIAKVLICIARSHIFYIDKASSSLSPVPGFI